MPGASALAHCETAAYETANTSVIMMIATSCAKLFASSLIVNSPHENRPIFCPASLV